MKGEPSKPRFINLNLPKEVNDVKILYDKILKETPQMPKDIGMSGSSGYNGYTDKGTSYEREREIIFELDGKTQSITNNEIPSLIYTLFGKVKELSIDNKKNKEYSELIKNYFKKSVDNDIEIKDSYKKLIDRLYKAITILLYISLGIFALPFIYFLYFIYNGENLDTYKTVFSWIIGIFGLGNLGSLVTILVTSWSIKSRCDDLDNKYDQIIQRVNHLEINKK